MLDPTEIIDLTQDSPVPIRFRMRNASNEDHSERNMPRHPNMDESVRLIDAYDIEHDNATRDQSSDFQCVADEFETENTSSLCDEQQSPNVSKRRSSLGSPLITLECPICLESLSTQKRPMTTICGHLYCFACLKSLFNESNQTKCPKCNRRVTWKSCVRLYL